MFVTNAHFLSSIQLWIKVGAYPLRNSACLELFGIEAHIAAFAVPELRIATEGKLQLPPTYRVTCWQIIYSVLQIRLFWLIITWKHELRDTMSMQSCNKYDNSLVSTLQSAYSKQMYCWETAEVAQKLPEYLRTPRPPWSLIFSPAWTLFDCIRV